MSHWGYYPAALGSYKTLNTNIKHVCKHSFVFAGHDSNPSMGVQHEFVQFSIALTASPSTGDGL